ncbi:carbohydrate esterase family 16 protein [Cystobasidium minutum MCA 4210]|uniref:carbohydrate esterase family 16 protein n=1 Tax=Cystobasidium minutum MCA 4210 TaxID=1397322 RepID=UPI0034CEBCB1|eukprot:jgi/Rhomi1/169737/fgenesh1_kg.3_\
MLRGWYRFACIVPCVCASVLPRQEAAASDSTPETTYVIFGDSYSDDCNAWRLQTPASVSDLFPFPACPPPGIYSATRSTGGYIWPELLRNGSSVNVLNYAVSGATCSNALYPRQLTAADGRKIALPAVDDQIESFKEYNASLSDSLDYTALIFIGTNDLGSYFSGFQYNAADREAENNVTVDMAARCVVQQVESLLSMGVGRVVVMNTTPLQYTPLYSHDQVFGPGVQVTQNGAFTSTLMKQLVIANNALQAQILQGLNNGTDGGATARVSIYDTYALFESLLLNPPASAYGPNPNVTSFCSACPTANSCGACQDPQPYFYADQLHPSEITSQLLAQDLARFFGLDYANPLAA